MPVEKDHSSPEAKPLLASGTNDASPTLSSAIQEDATDNTRSKPIQFSPNDETSDDSFAKQSPLNDTPTETTPTSKKSKSLKSSLNSPNSIDKPTKQLLFEVAEETASMNNEMNDGTTVSLFVLC